MDSDLNVLGEPLEECGTDPVTGFYRDGCCTSGPEDLGSHTVCAVMTAEFLAHQMSVGNDLVTPRPELSFPGLEAGRPLVRGRGPLAPGATTPAPPLPSYWPRPTPAPWTPSP